jgi:hypothetical protein
LCGFELAAELLLQIQLFRTLFSSFSWFLSNFARFWVIEREIVNHFELEVDERANLCDDEWFWSSFWSNSGVIFSDFEIKRRCTFATRFWTAFIPISESLRSIWEPTWTLLGARERLGRESVTLWKWLFYFSKTYVFEVRRAPRRSKIESESDARGECDFDAFWRAFGWFLLLPKVRLLSSI